jgi:hypothetical protein
MRLHSGIEAGSPMPTHKHIYKQTCILSHAHTDTHRFTAAVIHIDIHTHTHTNKIWKWFQKNIPNALSNIDIETFNTNPLI